MVLWVNMFSQFKCFSILILLLFCRLTAMKFLTTKRYSNLKFSIISYSIYNECSWSILKICAFKSSKRRSTSCGDNGIHRRWQPAATPATHERRVQCLSQYGLVCPSTTRREWLYSSLLTSCERNRTHVRMHITSSHSTVWWPLFGTDYDM